MAGWSVATLPSEAERESPDPCIGVGSRAACAIEWTLLPEVGKFATSPVEIVGAAILDWNEP